MSASAVHNNNESSSTLREESEVVPDFSVLTGLNHTDLATFHSYQQTALQHCLERIKEQEIIKTDYDLLAKRLSDIAEFSRHQNTTVQLGPHCLVRAEIIHTNEILVFLGDGYFVERTSKQAGEIVSRRLKFINETLNKLLDEKKLLVNTMDMLANLNRKQSMEEMVEIREKLDESHGPGEGRTGRENIMTDDDIRKRLDELEEEEKANQELPEDPEELRMNTEEEDEEYHDEFFKRPLPPPSARPRRSSLPTLDVDKASRKKSVTFAPFEGGKVPERENKSTDTVFKQALRMRLVGTRCKSVDPGKDDPEDWYVPPPIRTYSESGPPRLKKQAHINSMDGDLLTSMEIDPQHDTPLEPCLESPISPQSPADSAPVSLASPSAETSADEKPISRFKASRLQKKT